jgi:hypothetical protein
MESVRKSAFSLEVAFSSQSLLSKRTMIRAIILSLVFIGLAKAETEYLRKYGDDGNSTLTNKFCGYQATCRFVSRINAFQL